MSQQEIYIQYGLPVGFLIVLFGVGFGMFWVLSDYPLNLMAVSGIFSIPMIGYAIYAITNWSIELPLKEKMIIDGVES